MFIWSLYVIYMLISLLETSLLANLAFSLCYCRGCLPKSATRRRSASVQCNCGAAAPCSRRSVALCLELRAAAPCPRRSAGPQCNCGAAARVVRKFWQCTFCARNFKNTLCNDSRTEKNIDVSSSILLIMRLLHIMFWLCDYNQPKWWTHLVMIVKY